MVIKGNQLHVKTKTISGSFGAAYYRRFYRDAKTRAHSAREVAWLGQGLDGTAAWLLKRPLKSVIEIGAGPGFLRDWFARERPGVRYLSTDFSEHACAAFGHARLDVSRETARGSFDLVICQGVLQYLDDAACARAIANLAQMCGALLYLEALTAKDVRTVCDPDGTDLDVHLRGGPFYRRRLRRGFVQAGAGLWARKGGPVLLYELEGP